MITPFDIYLIGLVDSISIFLSLVGVFFFITGFSLSSDSSDENYKKASIISFFIALFICVIVVFIPSSKTLASMYVVPGVLKSVQDNKQIQQIPRAVLDLIKSYESKDDGKDK
jgi:uncharacterized membrane protein